MFDAKIQQVVDMFGKAMDEKIDVVEYKLDGKIEAIFHVIDAFKDDLNKMSRQTKIAIGISLGLSIADTILLFAILVKLGR